MQKENSQKWEPKNIPPYLESESKSSSSDEVEHETSYCSNQHTPWNTRPKTKELEKAKETTYTTLVVVYTPINLPQFKEEK